MKAHIREDIRESIESYVRGEHPYPFGGFVTAVLANDFVGAAMRADDENREMLYEYASFLYNEMPGRSGNPERDFWGSYEAVKCQIAKQRAIHEKTPAPEATV